MQEAKAHVKKTEHSLKNLQDLLKERENELATLKSQHDKEIAAQVNDALDKEQVSLIFFCCPVSILMND